MLMDRVLVRQRWNAERSFTVIASYPKNEPKRTPRFYLHIYCGPFEVRGRTISIEEVLGWFKEKQHCPDSEIDHTLMAIAIRRIYQIRLRQYEHLQDEKKRIAQTRPLTIGEKIAPGFLSNVDSSLAHPDWAEEGRQQHSARKPDLDNYDKCDY